MDKKQRKMLNFDLDQKLLKDHYPNPNYKYAYTQIGIFLRKNGFLHHQGSGYISKEPLNNDDIDSLIIRLTKEYLWLSDCVKEFTSTNIDKYTNLVGTIKATRKNINKQQHTKQDKHFSR